MDNIIIGTVDIGNAVQQFSDALEVKLYPNITSDYFTYKTENNESLITLNIVNMEGKSVFQNNNPKKSDRINISSLPSGNYFVKFIGEGKQAIKRLVIN